MIYIIGGGSGTGKTTISEQLGKRYGLKHYKADVFAGEHQSKADKVNQPVNYAISRLEGDRQRLHLLELDSAHELARQTELFFMFLDELNRIETDHCIIEGNGLRPELVTKHFDFDYKAVWLIPTDDFLRENGPKRSWLPEILNSSPNPDKTMQRWLERGAEYNDFIRAQAIKHQVEFLDIDGSKSIDQVAKWVIRKFYF